MIGIIGGTGFYNVDIFGESKELNVGTEYGDVVMLQGSYQGKDIVFLPRHGFEHNRLAYEITHHANIEAFRKLGVKRILTTVAAGGISDHCKAGDFVLLDQFVSWHTRHYTFGKMSLDMTEPYCSELRGLFIQEAKKLGYPLHETGNYFSFDGPRYETAAEIRTFKMLGADVVGMTNAPEATLAREAGICYSAVVIVTNKAAGLSNDEPDLKAHGNVVKNNSEKLQKLICAVAVAIPEQRHCRCQEWYDRAAAARNH